MSLMRTLFSTLIAPGTVEQHGGRDKPILERSARPS
jgi:hypothetical protein